MKKIAIISLGLVSSVLLNACATLSSDECLNANWKNIGFADAMKGRSIQLGDHSEACAKVKVTPDKPLYMQGYNEGAKQFCTYDNGLTIGTKGDSAPATCNTPELSKRFYEGYRKGKKRYDEYKKVLDKEKEIAAVDNKINDIRTKKVQASAQELDFLYREKEVLNKELALLKQTYDSLK
ncbi:MAG: DUF2799 domain-containing protein [bacterium]